MNQAGNGYDFEEVWEYLGRELAALPMEDRIAIAARLMEKSQVMKRRQLEFPAELFSLAANLLVEK